MVRAMHNARLAVVAWRTVSAFRRTIGPAVCRADVSNAGMQKTAGDSNAARHAYGMSALLLT